MRTPSFPVRCANPSNPSNVCCGSVATPNIMNTQSNNNMSRMLRCHRNHIWVSIALILSFFLLPKYAFTPVSTLEEHLLFSFSHANIFHLAANILCMWMIKLRLRLPLTLAISFVCSYLPQWSIWGAEPILGFSGVLFAAVGVEWGRARQFRRMLRYVLIPTIVFGLFPHIALTFHIYTLLLGYAAGFIISHYSHSSQ